MLIKLLQISFVSFFDLYKEYNSCLISFLSFSELFPAGNWAKVIGNLLSIWLGAKIFNPFPCCFCSLNSRIFLTISTISYGFSILCRLFTAKSRSARGASCQPASMGRFLTICQTCLSCPHLMDGCGCSPGLSSRNEKTLKLRCQL